MALRNQPVPVRSGKNGVNDANVVNGVNDINGLNGVNDVNGLNGVDDVSAQSGDFVSGCDPVLLTQH